jgi:hypothetical protein
VRRPTRTRLLRERNYLAEVEVDRIETDDPWSPYLTLDDARKLDQVRAALRRKDIQAASRHARVYRLTPVAAG